MQTPFLDAFLPSKTVRPMSMVVMRGSLITFNYAFHKPGHDSFPLVLVTDTEYPSEDKPARPNTAPQRRGTYLRGINLHYLTFPVIKNLIYPGNKQSVCDNPNFTYQYIKNNGYITSAFRQYKKNGIANIKKLDCQFVVNAMGISRSFDPNELEVIRKSVREQINRMVNPRAASTDEMPI